MPKSKANKTVFKQNIVLNRDRGQHLLINQNIIDGIVQRAALNSNDIVLEIGPGTGNLTMKLLPKCQKVIAIELDPRMVVELQRRVAGTEYQRKLHIIQGDVLKVQLPFFTKVVANIPYSISSPLIFRLLSIRPLFQVAILMLQKEFADRLVATVDSPLYCRLTVNTNLLAEVSHCFKVGKNNFKPPPQVDSAVVRIEPRKNPLNVNYLEWDGLTRICFNRKNKTLGASFKHNSILDLLEKNYNTYQALTGSSLSSSCSSSSSSSSFDAFDMDVDDIDNNHSSSSSSSYSSPSSSSTSLSTIREKVVSLLKTNGYLDKRASKLDLDDFLNLLRIFNEANFHFTT